MQGRSESRQRVVAHCRGRSEARLARCGIREHDAFLGHKMRGPAGTGQSRYIDMNVFSFSSRAQGQTMQTMQTTPLTM